MYLSQDDVILSSISPKSNMTVVLIRRGKLEQRDRDTQGECHVTTEIKGENHV